MSRDISATVSSASGREGTKPIYLIRMAWDTEVRIATQDEDIPWNSETWEASGAAIQGLGPDGGILILPNGDGDPWLNLVRTEIPRGRAVEVYEYHTDLEASPQVSDAELLFVGTMDETSIKQGIRINLIESQQSKHFPPTSIGPPTYNHLLPKGARLYYGPDIVTVN